MALFKGSFLSAFLFFGSALCFTGCFHVDTDPQPQFALVQEEVGRRAGEELYWAPEVADAFVMMAEQELTAEPLTVEKAVKIALLNNRNLQAVYESLGIAKAQLAQAGLLKNPLFAFSYRFTTNSTVTDLVDIALFDNFLELLLIPLKKRLAKNELQAAQEMVVASVLDVIAETKIAFFALQARREIWELKKQLLLAAELSYEAAGRLYVAGNLTDLELAVERTFYEEVKMELASWEIAVLEAREKLNIMLGLWGRQIGWETDGGLPPLPPEEGGYSDVESVAIAASVDLKAVYYDLLSIAAGFGVDTTRLVFPQFELGVSAEREDSIWYVGPALNLSLPFFDTGLANSAKARSKIMQQWNRYTALAIEIRSVARSSRFELLNAFRQSRYSQEVLIPLAEEVTQLALEQNHAMQIGVFDLLLTKRSELEKKIQGANLQLEYWTAKTRLQTLLQGHLPAKHLFDVPVRKYYDE